MDVSRLVEVKKRPNSSKYFIDEGGDIITKQCNRCEVIKGVSEFHKDSNNPTGTRTLCKTCIKVCYQENKESVKKYYLNNKDKILERARIWHLDNLDAVGRKTLRYRARKSQLIDNFTKDEQNRTLEYFEHSCALTGNKENRTWDHAIPMSTGHSGTTYGNMYPLRKDLNSSKNSANIFEWFEANRQRFELSQERFDNLIAWLASANAMSVEEYRDYVYWCHDNPRTIDELKEEAQ